MMGFNNTRTVMAGLVPGMTRTGFALECRPLDLHDRRDRAHHLLNELGVLRQRLELGELGAECPERFDTFSR